MGDPLDRVYEAAQAILARAGLEITGARRNDHKDPPYMTGGLWIETRDPIHQLTAFTFFCGVPQAEEYLPPETLQAILANMERSVRNHWEMVISVGTPRVAAFRDKVAGSAGIYLETLLAQEGEIQALVSLRLERDHFEGIAGKAFFDRLTGQQPRPCQNYGGKEVHPPIVEVFNGQVYVCPGDGSSCEIMHHAGPANNDTRVWIGKLHAVFVWQRTGNKASWVIITDDPDTRSAMVNALMVKYDFEEASSWLPSPPAEVIEEREVGDE